MAEYSLAIIIQLSKDEPYQIRYKYNHNSLEVWKVLDLKKFTRGHSLDLGRISLTPLYIGPRPLNSKNCTTLVTLCSLFPQLFMDFMTT